MKTTASASNSKPKQGNRKPIVIVCAIVIVLVGIFLSFDLPARQRFAVVDREVEKVRSDMMEPAGAVEWTKSTYTPYMLGTGISDVLLNCWFGEHCPVISRTWYVPIEPGKESEFFKGILQTEGYSVTEEMHEDCAPHEYGNHCKASGSKDKLVMKVGLVSTGGTTAPAKDVAPKVWRFVNVNVNYYWDSK